MWRYGTAGLALCLAYGSSASANDMATCQHGCVTLLSQKLEPGTNTFTFRFYNACSRTIDVRYTTTKGRQGRVPVEGKHTAQDQSIGDGQLSHWHPDCPDEAQAPARPRPVYSSHTHIRAGHAAAARSLSAAPASVQCPAYEPHCDLSRWSHD